MFFSSILNERKKHNKKEKNRKTKTTELHIEAKNVFFHPSTTKAAARGYEIEREGEKKKKKGSRCCWVLVV
jgi:regulatory protein YycI of two-component signal transduction system YycFG